MHQQQRDSAAQPCLYVYIRYFIAAREIPKSLSPSIDLSTSLIVPESHVSTTCSRLFSSSLRLTRRKFPSRVCVCIECVFQTAPFNVKYAAGMWVILSFRSRTVFSHVIHRHNFVSFLLSPYLLRSFIAPVSTVFLIYTSCINQTQ